MASGAIFVFTRFAKRVRKKARKDNVFTALDRKLTDVSLMTY